MLHGASDWSEAHFDDPPEAIAEALTAAFRDAAGVALPRPADLQVHRWRYALPDPALDERCLFDAELALGACGDWCGGPRVEGAFLSGHAVAERLLARLDAQSR